MSLEPGTRLGSYEVLAPIGAAAEERYKASDTRLNRVVTLKVLPPEFSAYPEMKARLERDTRTISSLNHPQICSLVDMGHQDPATDFLVTEYFEGETLAQRLARGPLELQEALSVAIALADALDKAHRQGVTHGGLSPSVVMLTTGGPKLLDFGLAKLQGETVPLVAGTMATTRTLISSLASVPTFGAAYMAPEQFAGSEADARSDIFAFGAILYEMATGRPAFHEKTLALLIAAVQTVDPEPVSKLQPLAPPALDYLVKRCLNKDPRQRLQTALDLTSELQWVAEGGSRVGIPAPVAARRQRRDRAVWAALAAMSVLAVGLMPSMLSSSSSVPEPEAVRFLAASLPTGIATPITISPDGRWLVSSPGGPGGSGVIALALDSVTAQRLITGNNVTQPFWSPDSRSLAFFEEGKLKRADVAGGPAQTICDVIRPFQLGPGTARVSSCSPPAASSSVCSPPVASRHRLRRWRNPNRKSSTSRPCSCRTVAIFSFWRYRRSRVKAQFMSVRSTPRSAHASSRRSRGRCMRRLATCFSTERTQCLRTPSMQTPSHCKANRSCRQWMWPSLARV